MSCAQLDSTAAQTAGLPLVVCCTASGMKSSLAIESAPAETKNLLILSTVTDVQITDVVLTRGCC
ncbi:hypothetical protein CKAH01_09171 [Colletotrichum kahawae]|uniref:Uncharacterized protein n=1 Tax=Colletotrichum kahawae TaxID=34407 RepID=A0AAE0CZE6_COLKA|nr:hypothetical protein CKAH01_09171 [Colletotrichum kahawae]